MHIARYSLSVTETAHYLMNTDVCWQPGPQSGVINDITISLTPYGALASLPIISNVPRRISVFANENTRPDDSLKRDMALALFYGSLSSRDGTYADLFWSKTNKNGTRYRGLLPLEEDEGLQAQSVRYPSYHILTSPLRRGYNILWIPVSRTPNQYKIDEKIFHASWQDILLRHRPPPRRLVGQPLLDPSNVLPAIPWQLTLDAPFRFDKAHIEKFMRQSSESRVKVYLPSVARGASDPNVSATYVFSSRWHHRLLIQIGRCVSGEGRHLTSAVWARVIYLLQQKLEEETVELADDPEHDCSYDHVSSWPGLQKTFALDTVTECDDEEHRSWLAQQVVTLSFTPCRLNRRTLILNATYGKVEGVQEER